MHDLIQDELRSVITAWAEGRRIHAIPLGHPVRYNEKTRAEEPHVFRQRRAYDYCFTLIHAGLEAQGQKQEALSWGLFLLLTSSAPKDLSTEERQAAESLAWKALNRGWDRALSGFPESHEIMLAREADA